MLVILTVFFVAAYLYHHFTKNNNYWKDRNVAGPPPTFFFGNMKELFLRQKSIGQIFYDICAKYPNEKVVGIFRMRTPDLLVRDVEIIKHILIKDFDLFMNRDLQFSLRHLGANLFHADSDTWQLLRKRFTPIFTTGKLKNMLYIMINCSDKLVDYVDKIVSDQPDQEVHKFVKKFTQENISACAFGLHLDCYDKHAEALDILEEQIFRLDHRSELEMMYPGILKKSDWSLMPRSVRRFFSNLAKDMINKRNGEPIDRHDFMDLLLALRKEKKIFGPGKNTDSHDEKILEVTDDIIASEMFIFYLAGYQTSAITISFMLYYLACYSDVQDKVVAEIEAVLKNHGGEFTYEALTELKYMNQVINETMRMQPVTDSVRRIAATKYTVPGTNLTVDKGQIFIIPTRVVHMDPNTYPNPEKFDPERFSPENIGMRDSCSFMAFGHGPRACIGMRFARIQMKICMAKLLLRFRLERSKDTPERFVYESSRLAVFPIGGFPMKLIHRY